MPQTDLQKIFIVALELLMPLYALVYAFPFVPDRILEDVPDNTQQDGEVSLISSDWFVVEDVTRFHEAIGNLLSTSRVFLLLLRSDLDVTHLNGNNLTSMQSISSLFELNIYDHDVPSTCRQMFQTLAATYKAMMNLTGTLMRQDLYQLYQYFGLVDGSRPAPANKDASASAMVQQCSEQAFQWLQPYFATNPQKYWPPLRKQASSVCS